MASSKATTTITLAIIMAIVLLNNKIITTTAQGQLSVDEDFSRLLGKCGVNDDDFDKCMKDVFNDLRAYFPTGTPSYNNNNNFNVYLKTNSYCDFCFIFLTGVPDYHIKPFDPHHASFVEIRRGDQKGLAGFKLTLRNVTEYGWTRSEVTKYHTDYEQKRIIYSQYFPEKSLVGWYEFSGNVLGTPIKRKGFWNMTLYDYR